MDRGRAPDRFSPTDDVRRVLVRWRRSAVAAAGRGYITDQWHFLPVTAAALAVIARRGHLLVGGPAAAVV